MEVRLCFPASSEAPSDSSLNLRLMRKAACPLWLLRTSVRFPEADNNLGVATALAGLNTSSGLLWLLFLQQPTGGRPAGVASGFVSNLLFLLQKFYILNPSAYF